MQNVEGRDKESCEDLNITSPASSPTNFIYRHPQIIGFDNGCETDMCLQCGGMPCYWDQPKEVAIATVRKDNTLPVNEDSNHLRRKWAYCAYTYERYSHVGK